MIARERWAWLRFLIVVVAASIGQTIGWWQQLPYWNSFLPLLFGGAAFYLTLGLGAPTYRRDRNVRYWRGRKLDD